MRPLRWILILVLPIVLAGCFAAVISAVIVGESPEAALTPTTPSTPGSVGPAPTPAATPSPTATVNAQPGTVLAAVHRLKVVSDSAVEDAEWEFDRERFGPAWKDVDRNGCDQRNDVLRRDLTKLQTKPGTNGCVAASGVLTSEYTGKTVEFTRGDDEVQIDHVVALAEAWRTGAYAWDPAKRERFANDPFNLEAVESEVNTAKGDDPPIYWLPDVEQCDFVNRYVSIKDLYRLGITKDEKAWLLREWGSDCDGTIKLHERADYKTPKARPIGEPKPKATPSPNREPQRTDPPPIYYENCTAVRQAGKAPIRRGDPGYGSHLDGDGDGVACET
jgi:excalibur calcium-binding domain-containing protein/uncharacterized protein DUF1524